MRERIGRFVWELVKPHYIEHQTSCAMNFTSISDVILKNIEPRKEWDHDFVQEKMEENIKKQIKPKKTKAKVKK